MIIQPPNTNLIINADCLTALKELPENSVDSIVTDPPYGLSFMGKKWDYDVPQVDLWKECMRVLKHGGFLLSFAGTRTYHRMAVNIEDAGFEIRDMISWLYGSGFPKSLNIGKQVDKMQGNEREDLGESIRLGDKKAYPRNENVDNQSTYKLGYKNNKRVTKGNSPYEGWGTALKPACEPIVVARKPLSEKNVALNCLKWGTGGINIDGCRVGYGNETDSRIGTDAKAGGSEESLFGGYSNVKDKNIQMYKQDGRFPANIILDEEAGKILDEQSGISKSTKRNEGQDYNVVSSNINIGGGNKNYEYTDKGGVSRFFYCAKAGKSERNAGCEDMSEKVDCDRNPECYSADVPFNRSSIPTKNNHPTVKPLKLMQYLVRLVTPKGGVCLDPFLGSGTTAIACIKEDMNYIGIEREKDYVKIANARINAYSHSKANE